MERLLGKAKLDQADARALDPWLELAADANNLGFFNWDLVEGTLRWNRVAEERMGLVPGTISSFDAWSERVAPEDAERIAREIAELAGTQAPRFSYRYRFTVADGDTRIMEGSAHCVYDDAGALVQMIGVNIDVTERERDRAQLARRDAQLRSIVETVPDAMIVIDEAGIVRRFNIAAERMFGRSADDVIGQNIAMLMPQAIAAAHDQSIASYLKGRESRLIGKTRQLTACRADGSEFPIELNVGEATVDGGRLFTGFIRDITNRVNAEHRLEEMRAQYLRGARLNAMGAVSAGLAHELNQPLSAAANYLAAVEIGMEQSADPAMIAQRAADAGEQLTRVGEIIRRLRAFVSSEERSPQRLIIDEVVEESLALAAPGSQRARVDITVEQTQPRLPVFADRIEVQQVIVNLLRNAIEAVGGEPAGERRVWVRVEPQGNMVRVAVEDNGGGFPAEMIAQRNMPFVPKKHSHGMGLGLSICRRIVDEMGGKFAIANGSRGGAIVSFTLPSGES